MPERASITQAVQVGVEAVPGTNVAASKLLNSMSLGPAVAVDMQRFRPQGQKFASIITPGKEWVSSDVGGVGSYSEIIYALSCLLNYSAPVQQGATTAYKWSYNPAARSEDTIKTLTVEQGGAVRAHKFNYGLFTEFGMDYSRDGVSLSGALIGQRLQDGIVLTAGPTAVEEKPILPTEIDIYLDTTSAGLGTTKLARVLSAGWSVGNRFNPLWTLNSVNTSFAAHVEAEPAASLRLSMEADAEGMAQLTQMRAGSTRFIRIKATSPDLAGAAFPYSVTCDFAAKVSAVSDFSDADGVYAVEWTFDVVYDATWAAAMKIDVINKQTAL